MANVATVSDKIRTSAGEEFQTTAFSVLETAKSLAPSTCSPDDKLPDISRIDP